MFTNNRTLSCKYNNVLHLDLVTISLQVSVVNVEQSLMDFGCHISHYPLRTIDLIFSGNIGRVKGINLHFNAVVKVHSTRIVPKRELLL